MCDKETLYCSDFTLYRSCHYNIISVRSRYERLENRRSRGTKFEDIISEILKDAHVTKPSRGQRLCAKILRKYTFFFQWRSASFSSPPRDSDESLSINTFRGELLRKPQRKFVKLIMQHFLHTCFFMYQAVGQQMFCLCPLRRHTVVSAHILL